MQVFVGSGNTLRVIDAVSHTQIANIPLPESYVQAIAATSNRVYVIGPKGNQNVTLLSVINTNPYAMASTRQVQQGVSTCDDMVVKPSGGAEGGDRVFLRCATDENILIIDIANHQVRPIDIPFISSGMALNEDASFLYVGFPGAVWEMSTTDDLSVKREFLISGYPDQLAVTGGFVYATVPDQNKVRFINLTNAQNDAIEVGQGPLTISALPLSNMRVLAINRGDNRYPSFNPAKA